MAGYFIEWISLFFRWFHVIAGVAWIGASFYFIWLDNSLEEPPQWKKNKGIGGDLWAIHGGGFYEVAKYKLGPEKLPKHLHWFKWEAYTTWLTGMALLCTVYYLGAEKYLIDADRLALEQGAAIGLGLAFISAGFVFYEVILRTPLRHHSGFFAALLFAFLVFMSWVACSIFSPRGAFIHIGALIGTIMAGNVLLGIMPSQRALVAAVEKGAAPDPRLGAFAKLRSTHNNYLTLPLIFIMISNHYPMIYTHNYNWLILSAMCFVMAFARHFFNLRHRGQFKPSILIIALVLWVLIILLLAPKSIKKSVDATVISDAQAMEIVNNRCGSCHAQTPSQVGFTAAPAGVILETQAQVSTIKEKFIEVTRSKYMPLGNITQMTEDERNKIIAWLLRQ
jgi:uncharacterized membrane protein